MIEYDVNVDEVKLVGWEFQVFNLSIAYVSSIVMYYTMWRSLRGIFQLKERLVSHSDFPVQSLRIFLVATSTAL